MSSSSHRKRLCHKKEAKNKVAAARIGGWLASILWHKIALVTSMRIRGSH